MPETPKKERAETRPSGSERSPNISKNQASTWEDDQKQHEYYYDDAHGYEVYENDETENDQMENLK